jgi:hypothetical protein
MSGAALIVAHPGHELLIHGWLEKTKPLVFILTDGSGSAGTSRVASSRRLVEAVGARPGPVFGAFTDRELYAAILGADVGFFRGLVRRVAEGLAEEGIDTVVGDAAEGYNPGHDTCRMIVDTAVAEVRHGGLDVASYDYPIVGAPPEAEEAQAMRVDLDDAALDRKLGAARGYSGLDGEVEAVIARRGLAPLRTERFHRVISGGPLLRAGEKPFYETYGEKQVAVGRYDTVLRFADHMLPLARALAHER